MNNEQITSSETAIVPHEHSPVVAKEDGNVAVTAFEPNDMPRCQEALKAWAHNKVITLDSDVEELQQALDHARAKKWKISTLQRHLSIAKKRAEFYRKIMCALEAGYVIVPNFPVQAFAIRTDRTSPRLTVIQSRYQQDLKQDAQCPEVGEGEYQNPFPVVRTRKIKDGQGNDTYEHWPTCWDEMDFPVSMAKGEVMEATSRAMALKIFDDIGILPKARKEDPIIVGQVHLRGTCGYVTKTVTFMLAWHLDTRVL